MKKLVIPLFIFLILLTGTVLVVLYGKGYRFGFENGRPDLSGTGLLVATSTPDGAQVFVNGHLTTATDNTINLSPNTYDIKIVKEGYFPWEKTVQIKSEVVTKAEALLFPAAPKLESITNSGADMAVLDPSQAKIAFTVASQTAVLKRGVYVLDMSARPILTLQAASTQIVNDAQGAFSKAKLDWSPDGSQIMATISGTTPTTYLLDAGGFNQSPSDVTETMAAVDANWQKMETEKNKTTLDTLPSNLKKIVSNNFDIIAWSLDESKILYKAIDSATLPIILSPRIIGSNSTTEQRTIKKDAIYAYDVKEDRNYKILDGFSAEKSPLSWFPDSKHLIYVHDQKVDIMDYDGINMTTVYAGPFVDNYVFPWPDGSKIVILTNLGNPAIPANLYTISLK